MKPLIWKCNSPSQDPYLFEPNCQMKVDEYGFFITWKSEGKVQSSSYLSFSYHFLTSGDTPDSVLGHKASYIVFWEIVYPPQADRTLFPEKNKSKA